jgi:hypothetical protein
MKHRRRSGGKSPSQVFVCDRARGVGLIAGLREGDESASVARGVAAHDVHGHGQTAGESDFAEREVGDR